MARTHKSLQPVRQNCEAVEVEQVAGLNHQVHGELALRIGCALLRARDSSDHSNQDEKSDLGQESYAHDGDR
jgi:hypothetical protein